MSTKDEVAALRARADALEGVAAVEDEYNHALAQHRRKVDAANGKRVKTPDRVNELGQQLADQRRQFRVDEEKAGTRSPVLGGSGFVAGDAVPNHHKGDDK